MKKVKQMKKKIIQKAEHSYYFYNKA